MRDTKAGWTALGILWMVVQHAVDPEPHLARLALGLDMDVAGPLVKGVAEQELHGVHDMFVRGLDLRHGLHFDELFEVAEVDVGGHFLGRRGDRRAEPVEFGDDLEDVGLRRDDPLTL